MLFLIPVSSQQLGCDRPCPDGFFAKGLAARGFVCNGSPLLPSRPITDYEIDILLLTGN